MFKLFPKQTPRGLVAIAVGTLLGVLGSTRDLARSAFNRPVSWADVSAIDLRPALESSYASPANLYSPSFSPSSYDVALGDADRRLSQEFRVTPGMRETVAFWLKVYTEYSSRHIAIYDDRHPELVYEVLDFRDLDRTARNRMVYEIQAEHRVKKTMREYRAAFARLSRKKYKAKSELEKRIVSTIARSSHKHPMSHWSSNLRSQTGQRDHIIKGLLAAETFFPQMEKIFREIGVPTEITRLSLVESSFNLRAVSRVGATGVWQFMLASAKEYMLVDPSVRIDERLSPLKSSAAAAKLLKRSYRMLDHWPLAITSYHNGYRGLKKVAASTRQGSNPFEYLSLCGGKRSSVGWASRNYYASFLAVLHAETYRDLFYGDAPSPQIRSVEFERVMSRKSALQIAHEHGIPLPEFRFYNPDIRDLNLPLPKGLWIALPGDRSDNLVGLVRSLKPHVISRRDPPLSKAI